MIVFVCLHGSVKSQIAAAHFNRVARERGLPFTAVSRGIQVDGSIPTRIRDGLSLDGLEPVNEVPQELTSGQAEAATRVLAFDPVPGDRRGTSEVTYWSDVPLPTTDYAAARDVIIGHIDALVPSLTSVEAPNEAMRGVVASVDQGKESITVRLSPSGVTGVFRVQDGLVFDAVRYGDKIEFTIEKMGGAKTIVQLRKE
jgi:Cu/Ag efflux protein CusF